MHEHNMLFIPNNPYYANVLILHKRYSLCNINDKGETEVNRIQLQKLTYNISTSPLTI